MLTIENKNMVMAVTQIDSYEPISSTYKFWEISFSQFASYIPSLVKLIS